MFRKIDVAATASGGDTMPPNKKPTRYKSQPPAPKPFYEEKNSAHGDMINAILAKYPEHKRVLFFKLKYENNEALSPLEISELEKFYKMVKAKESKA